MCRVQNRWHPPLQPKRLGRIWWNFCWKRLRRILSGAPRRFFNFILEPEIWSPPVPPLRPLPGQKMMKIFFQIDFFLMKSCSLVSKTSLKPIFYQVSSVFRPKIPFSLQGNVQVSSKCKMCRTFFEPTAPTDQTEYSRSMKFGMVTPYGNRRGVIEAIFDISPLTWEGWGTPGGS